MGDKPKHPVRLTNQFVIKLTGTAMWWDDDPKATGFGIRCYPGGSKSFFIDYRIAGRQRRYTIGPFPRWSAEAARERAKQLRRGIDQGQDPAGSKRERRTAPSIADLIDRYITDHLPKKSTVESRVRDEKVMLAEIGAKLGQHTKVADIHGGDIADMHRRITGSGRPVRANRILAICSKMFLPLNPAAIELIDRLRKKRKGRWVFPGRQPGEHLATLEDVWAFVRGQAGLGKDARVYDLRHTFASVGAGGGLSLPIIGRLLGHTQPRTTQRYAHLADDPLREATEKIGRVITGAGKPGAPVVPLRERGS